MTHTIEDHIIDNLRKHSWMAYKRHEAICEMLKEKWGTISWENAADINHDWLSYDRIWRVVQEEHPELFPQDLELQKKVREQNYEIKVLHMEPGFYQMANGEPCVSG